MLKNRVFYLFLIIFLFVLVFFVISNPPSPGTVNPVDPEESLIDSLDEYVKISTWISCYDENRNSDIVVDSKINVSPLPDGRSYYHNSLTKDVCFDYRCSNKNSCRHMGKVGLWGWRGPEDQGECFTYDWMDIANSEYCCNFGSRLENYQSDGSRVKFDCCIGSFTSEDDEEPYTFFQVLSTPQSYRPYLHRYEGECSIFTTVETKGRVPDKGKTKFVTHSSTTNELIHTIDWDDNQSDCEVIGGNWTDEAGFDGRRCCGDDYIWLFDNDLELYENDEISRVSYDPFLEADEDYEQYLYGDPSYSHFFAGRGNLKTDVGKWTGDDDNVLVCYNENDNYEWLSENDAANQNEVYCELFLGYNWTGSRCCGLDDSTYDDEINHCDAKEIIHQMSPENNFITPLFLEQFNSYCSQYDTSNRACFQGNIVENNTITKSDANQNEVYSLDGKLYFCNRDSQNQIYEDFEHVDKCHVFGTTSDDLAICGYTNDSWYDSYDASSFLGFDFSDYSANQDVDLVLSQLHESSLPHPQDFEYPRECCFFNRCWNGSQCVDEDEVYSFDGDNWNYFDKYHGDEYNGNHEYYVCHEGDWINSDVKLNHFKDYSDPGFCNMNFSCYCNQNSNYPYNYVCDADDDEVSMDCTINENFYSNDNYCLANYEGDSAVSSQWITRTKLVAIQLILMAQENDFVLFCDKFDNSVNYPIDLENTRYPINSVCVIEYDEKRIMGFSFNPEKEDEDALDQFLFDPSNGFLNYVIDSDNLEDEFCNALNSDVDGSKHGNYVNCINNSIWINKKLSTIIYSKDGISQSNIFSIDSYVDILDSEDEKINSLIDSISNKEVYHYNFKNPTDFSRFYYSKKENQEILGLIDKRYDEWKPSPPKLMNYIYVRYSGFSNVCNHVDFAKSARNFGISCHELNDDTYVLARTSIDNPAYWLDLTSKMRAN